MLSTITIRKNVFILILTVCILFGSFISNLSRILFWISIISILFGLDYILIYFQFRVITNNKCVSNILKILDPILRVVIMDPRFHPTFKEKISMNNYKEYQDYDIDTFLKFMIKEQNLLQQKHLLRNNQDIDSLYKSCQFIRTQRHKIAHPKSDEFISYNEVTQVFFHANNIINLIKNRPRINLKTFRHLHDKLFRILGIPVGRYDISTNKLENLEKQWKSEIKLTGKN